MPIYGSGDPASDAVEATYEKCSHNLSRILHAINGSMDEWFIKNELQLMFMALSQEPDAKNVARDLRQHILK